MTPRVRVFLLDDHEVVREVLEVQINAEADMEVVGTAGDAETAIPRITASAPDVALVDIDLPGLSGFTTGAIAVSRCPQTRIVFLSAFNHYSYIKRAIRMGAWGYVTKSEPFDILREGIREVAAGRIYFSPKIKSRILLESDRSAPMEETPFQAERLTEREIEILRCLAFGMSVKEIAGLIHISPKTVDTHKRHMMFKLNVHDRVELAHYAFRAGIANP